MFCSKCGSKVDDGAKFCNTCGNPIKQESKKVSPSLEDTIETKAVGETAKEAPKEETKANETVKETPIQEPKVQATPSGNYNAYNNNVYRAPKKPVNKKLIAIIVGSVVIAGALIIAVVINLRTINLNKYIGTEITGYEGYGYAVWNDDNYNKLVEDYGDKLTFDYQKYLENLSDCFETLIKKAGVNPSVFGWDYSSYGIEDAAYYLAQDYAEDYFYDCSSVFDYLYYTVYYECQLDGFDQHSDDFDYSAFKEKFTHLKNGDKVKIVWYDIDDELNEIKALKVNNDSNVDHVEYRNKKLIETLVKNSNLTDEAVIDVVYEFVKNSNPRNYFNYNFKYSNTSITAKGLTVAPTVDIFKDIDISYSGIAPNGSATITYKGEEVSSIYGITFNVSNDHSMYNGLDVGDVITATLSYDDVSNYINEYGGVPSTSSKEFTVDALDSLLTSASQIPSAALEDMKGKADGAFRYIFEDANQTGNSLEEFNYKGLYVLTRKDSYYNTIHADSKYYYDIDDKVILVYEVKVRNSGGSYDEVNTIYWCAAFDNILVKADGSLEYDIDTYHTPNNQINITGDNQNWFYYAYNSLDDLYNNQVAKNTDDYYVEESMQ